MTRLAVWHGGLSKQIYAQKLNKNGGAVGDRWEVTKDVIIAVMKHLHETDMEYTSEAGTLKFIPSGEEP